MKKVALSMMATCLVLAGCQTIKDYNPLKKEPKADASNPASVFCVERGGKSAINTAKDGSQYGVCQLPNGPTVEEWEFYRKHH